MRIIDYYSILWDNKDMFQHELFFETESTQINPIRPEHQLMPSVVGNLGVCEISWPRNKHEQSFDKLHKEIEPKVDQINTLAGQISDLQQKNHETDCTINGLRNAQARFLTDSLESIPSNSIYAHVNKIESRIGQLTINTDLVDSKITIKTSQIKTLLSEINTLLENYMSKEGYYLGGEPMELAKQLYLEFETFLGHNILAEANFCALLIGRYHMLR